MVRRRLVAVSVSALMAIAIGACAPKRGVFAPVDPNAPLEKVGGGNCLQNGAKVIVGQNHGHVAPVIPQEIFNNPPDAQAYVIGAGNAGHSHYIQLRAVHFRTLLRGEGLLIQTVPDMTGHQHQIGIHCRSVPLPN